MAQYTTGELAKLCGVTVRTVQYYDTRNILVPTELSEGGRRLYSEEDLHRMKIICFLRETGLSIEDIRMLLTEEEHPQAVIAALLDAQKKVLEEEMAETKEKFKLLTGIQTELKTVSQFTVESIGDIAHIMKSKEKRCKMIRNMIVMSILVELIEISTGLYSIHIGNALPFAFGMLLSIIFCLWISRYYYRHTAFICPECHTTFKGHFREMFFAYHTPRLRKMTCPCCKRKGFCVELYCEEGDQITC